MRFHNQVWKGSAGVLLLALSLSFLLEGLTPQLVLAFSDPAHGIQALEEHGVIHFKMVHGHHELATESSDNSNLGEQVHHDESDAFGTLSKATDNDHHFHLLSFKSPFLLAAKASLISSPSQLTHSGPVLVLESIGPHPSILPTDSHPPNPLRVRLRSIVILV